MNVITKFGRLDIWKKIFVISAVCTILGFAYRFIFRDSGTLAAVDSNKSFNTITQSVINSPNATVVAGDLISNVNRQIPLPLKFETSIGSLRTINKKLFDVLYILPNNKKAFIPVVERGKKYILFYTNEDLSEIYVPEEYRVALDMKNDACWIITLIRTAGGFDNYMERGQKSYQVPPQLSYE